MAYDDRDDDLDIRKSRGSGGGGGDVPNYLVQSIPLHVLLLAGCHCGDHQCRQGEWPPRQRDYEGAVQASEAAKKILLDRLHHRIFVQGGGCLLQSWRDWASREAGDFRCDLHE